jgi:lysophospholipase L1-like esterase
MRQILVYADSLSWGIVPGTRRRLPFEQRWPGVMERALTGPGETVRVLEDCVNGRRTVWDDPYKPGRNGLAGIAERIEAHSPLALVILMLGTNDFQTMHANDAWCSAQGVAALVRAIRGAAIEPGMPVPPVLVVAPPPFDDPRGPLGPKFKDAAAKSAGLADAFRAVATELGCAFFDAGSATPASRVDGIHLDADQHATLGRALATVVGSLLARTATPEEPRTILV